MSNSIHELALATLALMDLQAGLVLVVWLIAASASLWLSQYET